MAARAHGLCAVAGDKKPHAEKIRTQDDGRPETRKLVSLLAGHPAEEPKKENRSLSEVLRRWGKY